MKGSARMSPIGRDFWSARISVLSLSAAVAIASGGCGIRDNFSLPTTYAVKGKVLLPDGKPLTSGRIMFISKESGLTFAGTIGSDGTYTVKSAAREGAPAGNYKVRIEIDETSLPHAKGGKGQRSVQLPFGNKYTDEDTSELTASVKPDETSNNFEFKLTK
jgi:hypothetical protein